MTGVELHLSISSVLTREHLTFSADFERWLRFALVEIFKALPERQLNDPSSNDSCDDDIPGTIFLLAFLEESVVAY